MLVGDASGVTNGTLTYDVALDYARAPTDRRILPRVLLGAQCLTLAPTSRLLMERLPSEQAGRWERSSGVPWERS